MSLRTLPTIIGVLISVPTAALADSSWQLLGVEFGGSIAGEARGFIDDPQFAGQLEGLESSVVDGTQLSVAVEPEIDWASDGGSFQARLVPFYRYDGLDDDRTYVDVREAYLRYVGGNWGILAGINRVFWGVTESRHLVNIINQIDAIEDIDEEDFLGEPMVAIDFQSDYGLFSAYALPGFRERNFPGEKGRLRTPVPVDEDAAVFESGAEEWSTDGAFRYSHFLDEWDFGLSYFYGTTREPFLVLSDDQTSFEPRYDQIHQVGLDLQYTKDAFLFKFEGIGREGQGTFGALVGGFEYTFYQLFGTDADFGFLSEYLYDSRDIEKAPPTQFDNDVFVGARLTLNGLNDAAILAGSFVDVETLTTSVRVEAESRFGGSRKIELESQWFEYVDDEDPLIVFENDNYVLLRLTQFF